MCGRDCHECSDEKIAAYVRELFDGYAGHFGGSMVVTQSAMTTGACQRMKDALFKERARRGWLTKWEMDHHGEKIERVRNEMEGLKVLESGLVPVYRESERQVVDARELHGFLEVGKDFSNWIKDRIEKYGFVEGDDYAIFDSPKLANQTGRGGDRRSKDYLLTLDVAKELCMVENNERGRQARKYFIAVEKAYQGSLVMIPRDYAAALRAHADEVERRELAEKQRDIAIRTKAEIGSRREATAMATASSAVRKVTYLEDRLGQGRLWKQCKAVPWVLEHFAPSKGMWSVLGRKMAALSVDMGYEVRKIEDEKYGNLNAYHVDVWEEMRCRMETDQNMMGKYRRELAS